MVRADVGQQPEVEDAAERIEAQLGPIDAWINNAMVTVFSDVARLLPSDLKHVTDVTYLGAVWGTMAALKRMRSRGRGAIVQVGSALSYRSIPLQSAYCGAKSALRGFTDSLRSELIHDRSEIRLSMVHLPAVNTPQFEVAKNHMRARPRPLGKVFRPEVAAEAIVWAAEHERRELWVGWPTVQAIAGTRVAPALLDEYLARRGYEQLSAELDDPGRPDNLYQPVPGDPGIEGRFGSGAKPRQRATARDDPPRRGGRPGRPALFRGLQNLAPLAASPALLALRLLAPCLLWRCASWRRACFCAAPLSASPADTAAGRGRNRP